MSERTRLAVALEVRNIDDDARTFEGYGSVFGTLDSYADTVKRGAFKRSLKEWKGKGRMPAMLWQHNPDEPVGVWTEMAEDETGLLVKGKLLSTGRVPQAYEALKEGALSGLSIGFVTRKSQIDDESGVRTLTDVDLWEVSLVTFPANDPARVTSVRATGEWPDEREFEEWLRRDAGLSRAESKRVIATCYKRLLCDAEAITPIPTVIAGRHDEGNREALIALRSALSGVPAHGRRSEGPDR
jgi:HK97 family phage prohead protease